MKSNTAKIGAETSRLTTRICNFNISKNFRSIAHAICSSKLASWALVLSLLLQLVSGDRQALIRVQPGEEIIEGVYHRSGPYGVNASGTIRILPSSCSDYDDQTSTKARERRGEMREGEEEDGDKKDWVWLFYLPPLEESANAQGGTRCSLLDQVRKAVMFGASALLVLALNPGLFKDSDLPFVTDKPVILISDPKEVKRFQANVDLRKNKYHVNISVKQESASARKEVAPPKLTLWSTCGRSSGGSMFREWEGTVCLEQHQPRAEPSYSWVWRSLLSLIIAFYIVSMLRGMVQHLRENNNEDLEETLQRLAKQSMSKMSVWKYKRKKYKLSADSQECCAVCLDEFLKGQTIRMLPCRHQFHNRCVDSWLIRKRTCPLCKLDIIDDGFGLGKKF